MDPLNIKSPQDLIQYVNDNAKEIQELHEDIIDAINDGVKNHDVDSAFIAICASLRAASFFALMFNMSEKQLNDLTEIWYSFEKKVDDNTNMKVRGIIADLAGLEKLDLMLDELGSEKSPFKA